MYKVLIAEDESIERKVIHRILKKQFGDICEIYEAKNGKEAVEIFEEKQVQIAVLDIEMPCMSGLEAARQMRKTDKNGVIIFLTAFDEFSYAKQAISIRALDYLLKPYDEKELLFVIEEAMHIADRHISGIRQEITELSEILKEGKESDIRLSVVRELMNSYIEEHYTEDISMHDMAKEMNYSDAYFCKLFKQCFKENFTAYLASYRIEKAKRLLEDMRMNIKDVGKAVGYADSNYFSRVFKRAEGCTPSEYRMQIMKGNHDADKII
uniref:response regulator transcription factor n=1 Tax=Agathobacter sp. TaxID=2021311 RepID=UPI0040575C77